MNNAEFQLQGLGDPRLAVHATSALPAWLWSSDGARIWWANPVGARLFGAASGAELANMTFGPADTHRRQVAQLAGRLLPTGAIRLEPLRGFGSAPGTLVTCGSARFDFADGSHGVLIAAAEPVGDPMPLPERLQNLVEGIDAPVAAFTRDGEFAGASDAARPLLGIRNLSEAGLDQARDDALKQGRARTPVGAGHIVLLRLGSGADVGLVALIAPGTMLAARVPPMPPALPEAVPAVVGPTTTYQSMAASTVASPRSYEAAATTGEAPAEFALADEFTAPADLPAAEQVDIDAPLEPEPLAAPIAVTVETSHQTDPETPVKTPKNVLPFRPIGEPKSPVLTPVENSAFNEIARQLSERLDSRNGAPAAPTAIDAAKAAIDPPAASEASGQSGEEPAWLMRAEPPARGDIRRDRALLDLLPIGVLIYRLDRLLYANAAFLKWMGHASLHALEAAGGLDALYVEPGVSSASSSSDTGTPVTISASPVSPEHAPSPAADARLYTISWDDDSALALIFSDAGAPSAVIAALAKAAPVVEPAPVTKPPVTEPLATGRANAEELGAILDTTAEGIVMFDAEGKISSCNRSAEALFGYDGAALVHRSLTELFAPESRAAVLDYLASTRGAGVASLLDHGRDLLGRVRGGGIIPLSMTMGRTIANSPNFFAVFRDLSQSRKSEGELEQARRLAMRSASARADMLARISHEVRMPLNAIIGFADVMIGERFGALGNERYGEYMKDIRASGERVIAIIDNLLDLSRIETGRLDLDFANQNLNNLVESCVAVMQPQANRERIIIRTSLAHMLPPVVADARALRQIAMNLIANSIHLANAGGQVIVSTALSDFGEVVLRVRDTGHGLNDSEVAAAMEPFRTQAPSDQASDSSGVNLSMTRALVEANRAKFQIKTGPHSGTLIEVVFSHTLAKA
jgi:PAS domain S-box-containing protein